MGPEDYLDEQRLKSITDEMVQALTHPEYVSAMAELKSTPNEKRLSVVMERLTPEKLREKGVPLPEGVRISSRYFDNEIPAVFAGELGDAEKGLLRSMHEMEPGILDRIASVNPELLNELIAADARKDGITPLAGCLCACGGLAACGGLGSG